VIGDRCESEGEEESELAISHRMKISARSFGSICLLGGVGGAINAWLCYARIPVPIMGVAIFSKASPYDFQWRILIKFITYDTLKTVGGGE
jgi:hypothetical protein